MWVVTQTPAIFNRWVVIITVLGIGAKPSPVDGIVLTVRRLYASEHNAFKNWSFLAFAHCSNWCGVPHSSSTKQPNHSVQEALLGTEHITILRKRRY